MSVPVFVDTNILIYQQDISDPAKQLCADDWITFLARRRWARISFQVLQELYATLTRKLSTSSSLKDYGFFKKIILFRGGMLSSSPPHKLASAWCYSQKTFSMDRSSAGSR